MPIQSKDISALDFRKQLESLLNEESLFGKLANVDVLSSDTFGVNQSSTSRLVDCIMLVSGTRILLPNI